MTTDPASTRKTRLSIGAEELETFLTVAELGSFSKAAERLSLAQPSVTNRVQRLERDLRTRLFERTTRAVTLTPDGERLRARVEPVMRSLQSIIDDFCEQAQMRSQMVVVAATPMLATVLLPPIISRFTKANPAVQVELQDQITERLPSDIRSGRVDFALVARQPPAEGIMFDSVTADRFDVIGPRDHPALQSGRVSVSALTRYPFIILGAHRAQFDELAAEAAANGLTLRAVRTVKNVSTLLGLVAEGLGLTMLPRIILRVVSTIDDTRFIMATLEGLALTREYGIASLAGREWSPGARAFAAALRSELLAQRVHGTPPV